MQKSRHRPSRKQNPNPSPNTPTAPTTKSSNSISQGAKPLALTSRGAFSFPPPKFSQPPATHLVLINPTALQCADGSLRKPMIRPPANVLELPLEVRAEMALRAAVEKVI